MLGPVLAPVALAEDFRTLEEVVVTARRKEENMQEVPIAVTAFNDEYLREKNIVQLEDIRTHVPSLGVSVGGSSTNAPHHIPQGSASLGGADNPGPRRCPCILPKWR